ncbi:TonB-dependent receptor [Pseudohalioglobus sediminis]|uniref:TonB-dependent receptor n=1 Tax=Pseudohalioglobus sediminis TaxID=2606449 RepID=A0A5B0X6P5_9GAMM|nr:TonB-dependent receptor plug domain-containing protein [Pseudohalioglobus sediminis]KAA1194305.1 TonB-dependent receptor [Pseudohalioglobus sediminis]
MTRRRPHLALACLALPQFVWAHTLQEQVILPAPAPQLAHAPLSTSVFSGTQLDRYGVDSAGELSVRAPALASDRAGSILRIRGVGATQSSPVAVFLDDVYVGDLGFTDAANYFDLESVEVIRGPQGMRSGFNALGGVINLRSAAPSPTWQSKVVAELGSDDYRALQGLIRGPITDQFYMSVAGSTLARSRVRAAAPGQDGGALDNQYLRGAFSYHWNNLWYSTLQGSSADTADGRLETALLVNEVALGAYRVKYLGSWYSRDRIQEKERGRSHTVQVYSDLSGPVNFDAGLVYRDSEREQADSPRAPERDSLAAWTDLRWSLAPVLELQAGLRYSDEQGQDPAAPWGAPDADYWDWRVSLDYQWRDQLFYASTSTGHGSGPREQGGAIATPDNRLLAFEIGHRAHFLQQRLQTAVSLFRYELDQFAQGAGSAHGLEAEASWAVNDTLTLGGSWAHNDGHLPGPRQQLALFGSARWQWRWAAMEALLQFLYSDAACPCQDLSARQWDASISAGYGLWRLTAYVDNLADEQSAGQPDPPELTGPYADYPRSFGLRLSYRL